MSATQPSNALATHIRHRMDELGISSVGRLAGQAGVAPETVYRIFRSPQVRQTDRTLTLLAAALSTPLHRMRELADRSDGGLGPFALPPEADRLNARQRSVVLSMVQALLDAADREARGSGGRMLRALPSMASRERSPDGASDDPPGADRPTLS